MAKPPIKGMTAIPYGIEYMFDAWMSCVVVSAEYPENRVQFKADTGFDLDMLLKGSPLDHAIDKATGYGRTVCVAWLDWVTKTIWGEEGKCDEPV